MRKFIDTDLEEDNDDSYLNYIFYHDRANITTEIEDGVTVPTVSWDISRAERQKQNWCNGGMSKNSDGDSNFEAFELDNPQRVFQKGYLKRHT